MMPHVRTWHVDKATVQIPVIHLFQLMYCIGNLCRLTLSIVGCHAVEEEDRLGLDKIKQSVHHLWKIVKAIRQTSHQTCTAHLTGPSQLQTVSLQLQRDFPLKLMNQQLRDANSLTCQVLQWPGFKILRAGVLTSRRSRESVHGWVMIMRVSQN